MVLRIEDTDVERSETRYETQLLEDLKWMGIDWDEGSDVGGEYAPYRQSDRIAIYREHAERLVSEGKAYYCFCSQDELERDRDEKLRNQLPPIYSGKCRVLDPADAHKRHAAGEAAAIRLRIPEHPIRFHDIVHGQVEFSNEVVSDPIILRSTGIPVYNYVVVVDDALMKITHVIRGDDHLSNTPKQVALYEALGWAVPEFAHLSTILGADRERLSKRHGATSIANFRDMGVLPEALMNYLALLGWAPSGGTREIFSPEELKHEFSLERVTPSPAVFDMEKLYWLNRHYIKQSPPERIEKLAEPFFDQGRIAAGKSRREYSCLVRKGCGVAGAISRQAGAVARACRLDLPVRRSCWRSLRLTTPKCWPHRKPRTCSQSSSNRLQADSSPMTPERFKAIMNEVKTKTGAKGKDLFHPVRLALTGSHSGPEFDKLIPILEEGSKLDLPKHVMSVGERLTRSRRKILLAS